MKSLTKFKGAILGIAGTTVAAVTQIKETARANLTVGILASVAEGIVSFLRKTSFFSSDVQGGRLFCSRVSRFGAIREIHGRLHKFEENQNKKSGFRKKTKYFARQASQNRKNLK